MIFLDTLPDMRPCRQGRAKAQLRKGEEEAPRFESGGLCQLCGHVMRHRGVSTYLAFDEDFAREGFIPWNPWPGRLQAQLNGSASGA